MQITPKFSIKISCGPNNEHISKQLNKNISSCFSYDCNKEIISLTIKFFVFSSNESKFCFINKYKQTKAPSLTFFDSSFDNSNNQNQNDDTTSLYNYFYYNDVCMDNESYLSALNETLSLIDNIFDELNLTDKINKLLELSNDESNR